MTRNGLMAVAATALLALAGCGGGDGDSNKKLSYSGFGDAANKLCKSENAKVEETSGKLTGKAATDAPIYDELIPKLESATGKFEDLKPPEALQSTFDTAVQENQQQIDLAKQAQSAAKSGDQAAYDAVIGQLRELSKQSDLTASKLGAADCISD